MDRAALKARGKAAFKANYWKTVLVALFMAIIVGGIGGSSGSTVTFDDTDTSTQNNSYSIEQNLSDPNYFDTGDINEVPGIVTESVTATETSDSLWEDLSEAVSVNSGAIAGVGSLGLLIGIFLFGPLEVGCRSFFRKNLRDPEDLDELKTGFVPKYWRNVGAQLLASLFISLGLLVFIIPGIILEYAFAMVPYILAEDNDIGPMDAIRKSYAMMKGHKWELFVLDLSFIGWAILGVLTLGLLFIFYVEPYYYSTHAAYWEDLKARTGNLNTVEEPLPQIPEEA